jgi:catechol 2,3-dioxygenase-like lactoylglutathione lyase family enzyme
MKLKLHHVNFCTTNVPAMDKFYRSVLGLEPEPGMNASRVTGQGYPGDVSFVTDGTTQVHLAERDLEVGFRTGKPVNPMERGHIAFPHRRHRRLQAPPRGEGHSLCRLRRMGDERLAADLLLRSRGQRHRGPPGRDLTPVGLVWPSQRRGAGEICLRC